MCLKVLLDIEKRAKLILDIYINIKYTSNMIKKRYARVILRKNKDNIKTVIITLLIFVVLLTILGLATDLKYI